MTRHRSLLLAAATIALAACKTQPTVSAALTNPSPAELAQPAPDSFKVVFETSKGAFTVQAFRAWAPNGVDRFHYLVKNNYYDGVHFFRVLPNFVVQFGLHGNPALNAVWAEKGIDDDPVKQSNQRGMVTYAMSAQPRSRTVQLFINKVDNARLDATGFAPFAKVVEGMEVVEQIYGGYGEQPNQGMIRSQGNTYLNRAFPQLDSIVRTRLVK